MPFWGSYVQGRVARADVCVVLCVCECLCVCDYEYVNVCNRSTLTLLPAPWGGPPPNTFFSRMTSLAGRQPATNRFAVSRGAT